jgi:hypothetical protein
MYVTMDVCYVNVPPGKREEGRGRGGGYVVGRLK